MMRISSFGLWQGTGSTLGVLRHVRWCADGAIRAHHLVWIYWRYTIHSVSNLKINLVASEEFCLLADEQNTKVGEKTSSLLSKKSNFSSDEDKCMLSWLSHKFLFGWWWLFGERSTYKRTAYHFAMSSDIHNWKVSDIASMVNVQNHKYRLFFLTQ